MLNAFSISVPNELIEIIEHPSYNRYATPTQAAGRVTSVQTGFYVEGMSSLRAQTMVQ